MLKKTLITLTILIIAGVLSYNIFYDYLPGKLTNSVNVAKSRVLYNLGMANSNKSYENEEPSDDFHLRSVEPDITLKKIIQDKHLKADKNINLYIELDSRTLYIRYNNENLKTYRIAAGAKTYLGAKEKEGDYRTPKGQFFICTKQVYSPPKGYIGSRWMLLSYPNVESAERGVKNKLISQKVFNTIEDSIENQKIPPQDTPLGNAIGIHGGARPGLPKDWTAGCIGMYDQDVEEIFEFVSVGTSVIIN